MGNIGFGEFLLIVIVVLLIFGTSKLPALGDALGRTVSNFKKAAREGDPAPKAEPLNITPAKAVIEVTAEKEAPPKETK